MIFFIKEWPDRTATLLADNGTVLWTFASVEEACRVCDEWYRVQGERVTCRVCVLQGEPVAGRDGLQDPSCAACAVG